MAVGQWTEAEDTVAKLLVAAEQASLDAGDFRMAWLLTHLPEPPWARVHARSQSVSPGHHFTRLADADWVASAIAYIKDMEALQQVRNKPPLRKPPGRDKTKEPQPGKR